ncbi:MAG: four helix bundle protein [Bacteroidales bacterium]|nr:four helix bundle protein [Bacteroidales bacterium]
MASRNFREYPVWKDAVKLATFIYKTTGDMPWFEKKGLCDQMQRAVVSISSNIAEGCGRESDKDFVHFLSIALGSSYEVETQITIANNIGYIDNVIFESLANDVKGIEKQLNALITSIHNDK